MSSFGQVPLKDVQEMLNRCAPGHRFKETDHFFQILFNALTYPDFPKKRQIDVGHVRKMARHFGITDCCKKFFSW